MIQRHHEHSFDLDLIAKGDWCLDIGCRGWLIPKLLAEHGARVVAVDADPDVSYPLPSEAYGEGEIRFMNVAVVHRELAANKKITLYRNHDPQAASTIRTTGTPVKVGTASIASIMAAKNIQQFALIKLDCEGAEYRLLHDLADAAAAGHRWARQISVEFHDHCGLNPVPDMDRWYTTLFARLAPWYDVSRHIREVPPWGGTAHYIDTLITLRREFWT